MASNKSHVHVHVHVSLPFAPVKVSVSGLKLKSPAMDIAVTICWSQDKLNKEIGQFFIQIGYP